MKRKTSVSLSEDVLEKVDRYGRLGGDPKRTRVYVVVSRQASIDSRFSSVICAPVFSHGEGLATQVRIGPNEWLKHESWIMCDQLVSVPKGERHRNKPRGPPSQHTPPRRREDAVGRPEHFDTRVQEKCALHGVTVLFAERQQVACVGVAHARGALHLDG